MTAPALAADDCAPGNLLAKASVVSGAVDAALRARLVDGVVTQEWTASGTHSNTMRRGDLVAEPTGEKIEWRGVDVIPYEDGLIKRKDVYSDSVSILRQVGLLD
jgi:hypothetical protein